MATPEVSDKSVDEAITVARNESEHPRSEAKRSMHTTVARLSYCSIYLQQNAVIRTLKGSEYGISYTDDRIARILKLLVITIYGLNIF